MQPYAFVPSERRCIDGAGNGLVVALCGQGPAPMLQLVTGNGQTGQSIHVPPDQLPALVWAMLERSGGDPGTLLDAVRDIARAPAGPVSE